MQGSSSERAQMLLDRRKNINRVIEKNRWCTWVDEALNLTLEAMSCPIPKDDAVTKAKEQRSRRSEMAERRAVADQKRKEKSSGSEEDCAPPR